MHWLDLVFDWPEEVGSDWGLQTWSAWQSVYLKGQCSNFCTCKSVGRIRGFRKRRGGGEAVLKVFVGPTGATRIPIKCVQCWCFKMEKSEGLLWDAQSLHLCTGAPALWTPLATGERRSSTLEELLWPHLHRVQQSTVYITHWLWCVCGSSVLQRKLPLVFRKSLCFGVNTADTYWSQPWKCK